MRKLTGTTVTVILAGLAGGTAEIVWVSLFCLAVPLQSSLVAVEITRSFLPGAEGYFAVVAGLTIHFVLAVLIAAIFAKTLLRVLGNKTDMPTMLSMSAAALFAIWAINFFVLLPVINPVFVTLMPYSVTLISKLGFGFTMGWVLKIRLAGVDPSARFSLYRRRVRDLPA